MLFYCFGCLFAVAIRGSRGVLRRVWLLSYSPVGDLPVGRVPGLDVTYKSDISQKVMSEIERTVVIKIVWEPIGYSEGG